MILLARSLNMINPSKMTYLDLLVQGRLLSIIVLVVVRVHAQVVELELISNSLLERGTLLQRQAIGFGNYRHDIDKLAKLFQHDNVDRLESVTSRLDEVQAAVYASILNVALSLSCKLLVKISTVLVLDVLDNWLPASIVVDQITETGCVHNVQA